jgi:hypothetical protein
VVRAPVLLQAVSVMVDVVCACGRKEGYLDCIIEKKFKFLVTCNGVGMKS